MRYITAIATLLSMCFVLASCASEGVLPMRPPDEPQPEGVDDIVNPEGTRQSPSPNPHSDDPDAEAERQTLTIAYYNPYGDAVFGDSYRIREFFRSEYPHIELEFLNFADPDDEFGLGYTTKLTTMLMSGTAPDIFMANYGLRIDKLLDGGFVENLYPYIQADPDIDIGDYFPNIINEIMHEDVLYILPYNVWAHVVLVNREYVDIVSEVMGDKVTINYLDMIRCYDAIMSSPDAPSELYIQDVWQADTRSGHRHITWTEAPRFFDIRSGKVDFGQSFIDTMHAVTPYLAPSNRLAINRAGSYRTIPY